MDYNDRLWRSGQWKTQCLTFIHRPEQPSQDSCSTGRDLRSPFPTPSREMLLDFTGIQASWQHAPGSVHAVSLLQSYRKETHLKKDFLVFILKTFSWEGADESPGLRKSVLWFPFKQILRKIWTRWWGLKSTLLMITGKKTKKKKKKPKRILLPPPNRTKGKGVSGIKEHLLSFTVFIHIYYT